MESSRGSRPRIRWRALVMLVIAASACRAGGRGGEERAPAPAQHVIIEVENRNWADIVVYALPNGVRKRLGIVTSMRRESFRIPVGLIAPAGDLLLLADPVGSAPHVLPPVMVRQGQRVELILENNLRLSSVSVW